MLPGLKRCRAQAKIIAWSGADNDDIDIGRADDLIQLLRCARLGIAFQLRGQCGAIQVAQSAEPGTLGSGEVAHQIGALIAKADNSNACRFGVARHTHLQD